jgi:hypothetical protein
MVRVKQAKVAISSWLSIAVASALTNPSWGCARKIKCTHTSTAAFLALCVQDEIPA